MLDAAAFLRMLQLELNGRPPMAAVLKAALTAEPVRPRRTQQGLFVAMSPEPEKLELTIARIRHLTGPDKVGTAELVDTHRPDSFRMQAFAPGAVNISDTLAKQEFSTEARLSLRRFRPPKYAQVIVAQERPVRISSPAANGAVVMAKGPWRTSGEWWRVSPWKRDEWDVETAAGGLYRLYQEIGSRRWFVEGSYD